MAALQSRNAQLNFSRNMSKVTFSGQVRCLNYRHSNSLIVVKPVNSLLPKSFELLDQSQTKVLLYNYLQFIQYVICSRSEIFKNIVLYTMINFGNATRSWQFRCQMSMIWKTGFWNSIRKQVNLRRSRKSSHQVWPFEKEEKKNEITSVDSLWFMVMITHVRGPINW
jgi:hypothetical protein